MFKEKFIELCAAKGESPSSVCNKIGISPAAFSQWDNKTIPRKITQQNTAKYFGVTIEYLLGKQERPTADGGEPKDPTLEEAWDIIKSLSPEHQKEALNYLKFLSSSEEKK